MLEYVQHNNININVNINVNINTNINVNINTNINVNNNININNDPLDFTLCYATLQRFIQGEMQVPMYNHDQLVLPKM